MSKETSERPTWGLSSKETSEILTAKDDAQPAAAGEATARPLDETMLPVRRWVVPRPDRDGNPVGVLTVEVVAASAYDELKVKQISLAGRVQYLENCIRAATDALPYLDC